MVKTQLLKINPNKPEADKIDLASKLIKRGELVAFPTETVYGLGADVFNTQAVAKIFTAKDRPGDNPLITHVSSSTQLVSLVESLPCQAEALIDKFWPGPLTLVFKRNSRVPEIVSAGQDTIAIRMPTHPIALALIKAAQTPIAAPSANLSSKPSPTKAQHVLSDLKDRISLIIDGGESAVGIESTVLDLTSQTPTILRPGTITKEQIEKVIGPVAIVGGSNKSPGTRYKHYSPSANLVLKIGKSQPQKTMPKTGYILHTNKLTGRNIKNYSSGTELTHNLYSWLRELDTKNVDTIYVYIPKSFTKFTGLYDRLTRAADQIEN